MAQPEPTNATASSSNGHLQPPPISWEGDRMFNVYIHDYFVKRGFRKAAKELLVEADIGRNATPPINARQGFLFEWWNVFWMFFSAKTTGNGPENIMLYFHWMQTTQAERNRAEAARLGMPVPPPMPGQHGQNALRSVVPRPPQGPPNGVRPPGVGLSNGTGPMPLGSGQPPVGGSSMPYPMGGIPHGSVPGARPQSPPPPQQQINGIIDTNAPHGHSMSGPQRPPSQQQNNRPVGPHGPMPPQQSGHPPPSHPGAPPHLQAAPRQISRGHDTIRGPGPYHSPSVQEHPQNPTPQGSMPHPQMGIHTPMTMGMPPGPHMPPQHMGRPPPPSGGQPTAASPRGPNPTSAQPPFQPLMNPGGTMGPPSNPGTGSRSATPAGNMLSQRSPALASREPPPHPSGTNMEQTRRYSQPPLQPHPSNTHMAPPPMPPSSEDLAVMEREIIRIPPVFFAQMKQESGVGERDVTLLSHDEKCRLFNAFKKTMKTYNASVGPSPPGPQSNTTPTNTNFRYMSAANQPPMAGMPMGPPPPGVRGGQPSPQQPVNHRGQKRSSTSPDDLPGDTPKDQSPPERKRQRQSPQGAPGAADSSMVQPPMSSMSGYSSNPAGFMGPQGMPNGFRPSQMGGPMGPHPGQAMANMGPMNMGGMPPNLGHPMPPGMAPPMNPALANQHLHQMPGQPPQQQGAQSSMHYRPNMPPQIHKLPGSVGVNPGNPSGNDGSNNRSQLAQNKPGTMMPPPSPAHRPESINAQKPPGMMPPPTQPGSGTVAATNPSGSSKEQTAPSPAGSRLEGAVTSSPRTRPPSSAGAGNATANSNTQNTQPPTPAPNGNPVTAQSPSTGLASRISPTATLNTLSRPQTSGPDATTSNNSLQSTLSGPPSSAPPPNDLTQSLFGDFFSGMEDNFGIGGAEDFSQWIDMNGSGM